MLTQACKADAYAAERHVTSNPTSIVQVLVVSLALGCTAADAELPSRGSIKIFIGICIVLVFVLFSGKLVVI